MPGRMHKLEQQCLQILAYALRLGLSDDDPDIVRDHMVDDNDPTFTIWANGKPIIQIVVIATDLRPSDESKKEQSPS
jgi:hypothetical protein